MKLFWLNGNWTRLFKQVKSKGIIFPQIVFKRFRWGFGVWTVYGSWRFFFCSSLTWNKFKITCIWSLYIFRIYSFTFAVCQNFFCGLFVEWKLGQLTCMKYWCLMCVCLFIDLADELDSRLKPVITEGFSF